MKPSDITVVIPTYKRPHFLARSLESVLQQDIKGLRIRVIDNGSGDETESVVREHARRQPIDYIRHPTNIGVPANMIFAINSVDTEYCLVLNDDDMHLPGLIEEAMRTLPAYPGAAAFCGRMLMYRSADHSPIFVHGSTWEPGYYEAGKVTAHMVLEHFPPTAVMYRTRALVDAKMELSDREMMARFADVNGFVASDKILGAIVVHPQGWTSNQSRQTIRRMLLSQLIAYLQLASLSDGDKLDILLSLGGKIFENELKGALAAVREDASNSEQRSVLAKSAAALSGIAPMRSSPPKRAFYRLAATLASRKAGLLAGTSSRVIHAAWRASRAADRLRDDHKRVSPAERHALDQISELDRKAKAFWDRLRQAA